MSLTVAIDGPSGSGKSTVAREVARRLNLAYLDTGAMYRALTWYCQDMRLDLTDRESCAAASRAMDLRISLDPGDTSVWVGPVDVTRAIRASELSAVVSLVATNLAVRADMRDRQRALIEQARQQFSGVVAEGRDITTVVAPDAEVRILLLADEGARLRRRAAELHGSVDEAALDSTRDQVARRDRDDSTVSTFLEAADGVTTVDSSYLSLEETVLRVLEIVEMADAH